MLNWLGRFFRARGRGALPFVPRAGHLLSVYAEDGIAVAKLLAVDDRDVHMRLYVQRFPHPPKLHDITELSLAPFGPDFPQSVLNWTHAIKLRIICCVAAGGHRRFASQ